MSADNYDALEEAIGADMAIDKLTDEIERLRTVAELAEIMAGNMIRDLGNLQKTAAEALAASKTNASEIVKTVPIKGGRRLICQTCEKEAHWLNHDQICEDCE